MPECCDGGGSYGRPTAVGADGDDGPLVGDGMAGHVVAEVRKRRPGSAGHVLAAILGLGAHVEKNRRSRALPGQRDIGWLDLGHSENAGQTRRLAKQDEEGHDH